MTAGTVTLVGEKVPKPERPLRVLYVMHNAAPGGAARSLLSLIGAFPPGTVDPVVLAPGGYAEQFFRDAGIELHKIPAVSMFQSIAGVPLRGVRIADVFRTAWHARHGRILRRCIRELQPDLVHLNDRGMLHAARVARRLGVPVVAHARCVADRKTRWAHKITIALLRRLVDRVVAIDGSVRRSLRELPNCDIVYNPVQTPAPSVFPVQGPDGRVRVSYLGNLADHKGIWDLLGAVEQLQHRPEIVYQIAGGNTRPPGFHRSWKGRVVSSFGFAPDTMSQVCQWLDSRGLAERVTLVGHVEDVGSFLARTDILVFPSHLNGPGRSVFEAGLLGIPSIVALVDRVDDVVKNGVTGLVVPERDPTALGQAIERLADDPELRRQLGAAAREHFEGMCDPSTSASRVLAIYADVLRRRQTSSVEPAVAMT